MVLCNFINYLEPNVSVPDTYEIRLTQDNGSTPVTMVPGQVINVRDSGGIAGYYSNGQSYRQVFESSGSNGFTVTVGDDFDFEHSTYALYDRLGVQTSNDNVTWTNISVPWLQKSATSSAPWSESYAGSAWNSTASKGGWIFPLNVPRAILLGSYGDGIFTLANVKYVRFWFFSDGSVNKPGWDLLITAN